MALASAASARRAAAMATLLVLAGASAATAQAPQTDIYLADLLTGAEGWSVILAPVNVTNRPDFYDNQPFFTPDGRSLLYTAAYDDGNDGQTDIHRLYLQGLRDTRITRTEDMSEYSPTPVPGDRAITVVRVEPDSTQRLWRMSMEGMDAEPLFPRLMPVGYHAWGDEDFVIMFVLGQPPALVGGDPRTGKVDTLATGIGRSMHRIPDQRALSYTQRTESGESWIMRLDMDTRSSSRLVRALDDGDFHAWTPRGTILMASGSRIYEWNPRLADDWHLIADFTSMGLSFSRIAVSPDGARVALVAARVDEG
ncbi:MAG: hypothetical protein D6701_13675 [Gemmatimonadetes bacterium]|nr:MAG: hypothetical protein D6701_13675 [Gemmatimonadota bacterium]